LGVAQQNGYGVFASRNSQESWRRASNLEKMIPMKLLKNGLCLLTALVFCAARIHAEAQPPEQLLPDDTYAVLTIPDWQKLDSYQKTSTWGQFWNDPAMRPFRENFEKNFTAGIIEPIEKELGLKLTDYKELLQGQLTLAATPAAEAGQDFELLLLLDAKDKGDVLASRLAELKKKWSDSGKEAKGEKIREVDFSSIKISSKDVQAFLKKVFPANADNPEDESAEKKEASPITLHIGQSKSLLIVGQNTKFIEKVIARHNGGQVTPLADQPIFQKSYASLFRDSLGYGWLNFKPVYNKIVEAGNKADNDTNPGMKADKILPALGLSGLESVAGKFAGNAEGTQFEAFVSVPESQREGLFKIFSLEKKDVAPPAFVPADVLKYQRWRVDMKKGWATLEATLSKIEPSLAGMVQLMLGAAGKDKDPNFDLKKNLIENLGDDVIVYTKAPKANKAEELQNAPGLVLIGSPNPGQLLDAMRMLVSLVPGPVSTAPVKEREFLGKKIYSIDANMSPLPAGAEGAAAPKTLNFTASSGYLAFSTDSAALEEYLRSNEGNNKSLRDVAGFGEAVQKLGGSDTGFLTYENQKESMRVLLEAIKNDPEGMRRTMFFGMAGGAEEGEENRLSRWFKLELLPAYDSISKYFGITVGAGSTAADGFHLKGYAPTPAGVRK
jgi:hypothetical protein